jgi:hypothetical protein
MTEAAIAGHRLELTRATCVGPVRESAADGLPREKGWSADQQAFVQQAFVQQAGRKRRC